MMRVADYIAGTLARHGVKCVFMVSGGGMMHLIDAVPRAGLKYVCNHHEQACAMAAEGYARRTGELGVCYATSGPGATNILTGLVGAWQDSAPVLFLTGQSNVKQTIQGSGIEGLRQFGTFEVDIVPIVKPVTKYAAFVNDASTIRMHLEKAIALATSGRPGPVLLDIPLNIQGAPIDPATLQGYTPETTNEPDLTKAIGGVIDRLRAAKRPLILAGHGVRMGKAASVFREVVESLGVPVALTQLGKDLLPYDHPLFVGHPGVKGDRAGNFAVQNADMILCIGCSLHAQTTGYDQTMFAPNAYKIQVDLDAAVLQREQANVQEKIRSDVTVFLHSLRTAVRASHWNATLFDDWKTRCREWKEWYAVRKEPHIIDEGPVNLYEFADVLSDQLQGDETVVTDAGCSFYVMGQAFKLKNNQRYIVSGALGSMGYALPAGIGAAEGTDGKPVICVTGDGSLQTNIQELAAMRHVSPNLKLFVISNDGYASIRNTQQSFFQGYFVGSSKDSGVWMPPLQKIAEAYDLPYVLCGKHADLHSAIERTLSQNGPVICEVLCQANQQIIPSVTSIRLPDGRMQSKNLDEMFPFLEEGKMPIPRAMDG